MAPLICRFGPFTLDLQRGTLVREGRPIALGAKGLSLLGALLQAPGQVLSKSALMDVAWPGLIVEESNLTVQIAALRKLLGPQPDSSDWIVTVKAYPGVPGTTRYRTCGFPLILRSVLYPR